MKKTFLILLLITSLFISCKNEIPMEEAPKPPVEETEKDIISNLANKYIELLDVETILKDCINSTSVKSDAISIVSKPVVKDNTIVFTVELKGKPVETPEENLEVKEIAQLTDEISKISEVKGFLKITLNGLTMGEGIYKQFLTYSYKLSNPSSDETLLISDDKNTDVNVYLYKEFGGDVFAELSINDNKLSVKSSELIATPLLPINDSYLLINWNQSKINDISKTPEVIDKQEKINAEISKIEIPYVAKELLSTFKEEQLRYAIATLHKEIGNIDRGMLAESIKTEAKEINKQPHMGVGDYLFMNPCGDIGDMGVTGTPGLGWMLPTDATNFVSSSGLKFNGLYFEIKQAEDGTKSGDAVFDITFVDDSRQYFKNGKAKIKGGTRLFIALKDCTFGYMGPNQGAGDNMKLTSKTYNISTSPNELLAKFTTKSDFEMPEKGSLLVEYGDKVHTIDVTDMTGEANIYIGVDFIKDAGYGIKTTLELNSIGNPTGYEVTFDGEKLTSAATM